MYHQFSVLAFAMYTMLKEHYCLLNNTACFKVFEGSSLSNAIKMSCCITLCMYKADYLDHASIFTLWPWYSRCKVSFWVRMKEEGVRFQACMVASWTVHWNVARPIAVVFDGYTSVDLRFTIKEGTSCRITTCLWDSITMLHAGDPEFNLLPP